MAHSFYGTSSVSVPDIIKAALLPTNPSVLDIITAAILWPVIILGALVVIYGPWLAVRALFAGKYMEACKVYAKTMTCLLSLTGVGALAIVGIPFFAQHGLIILPAGLLLASIVVPFLPVRFLEKRAASTRPPES